MSHIPEQLQQIRQKVIKLSAINQELVKQNEQLRKELLELRELAELQKNTIKDLEEKNKITKIADAVSLDAREKRGLKLKINQYIREIDRCIALLND